MKNLIPLLGRVFLGVIFLMAGIGKVRDIQGTQAYMEAFGVPLVSVLVYVTIIIEIVGALMLFAGYKAKFAAIIMALFLIVVSLFMHTEFSNQTQLMQFLKNFAVIGGLLYVFQFGAGGWSFDGKSQTKTPAA